MKPMKLFFILMVLNSFQLFSQDSSVIAKVKIKQSYIETLNGKFISINGFEPGAVPCKEARNFKEIELIKSAGYKIVSYSIIYSPRKGDSWYFMKVFGEKLPENLINHFNKKDLNGNIRCYKGDVLTIYNIEIEKNGVKKIINANNFHFE